jgi:hypothetical protein
MVRSDMSGFQENPRRETWLNIIPRKSGGHVGYGAGMVMLILIT